MVDTLVKELDAEMTEAEVNKKNAQEECPGFPTHVIAMQRSARRLYQRPVRYNRALSGSTLMSGMAFQYAY